LTLRISAETSTDVQHGPEALLAEVLAVSACPALSESTYVALVLADSNAEPGR
jgi:hypothetical protein